MNHEAAWKKLKRLVRRYSQLFKTLKVTLDSFDYVAGKRRNARKIKKALRRMRRLWFKAVGWKVNRDGRS